MKRIMLLLTMVAVLIIGLAVPVSAYETCRDPDCGGRVITRTERYIENGGDVKCKHNENSGGYDWIRITHEITVRECVECGNRVITSDRIIAKDYVCYY